jgi:hypothetical protein
MGRGARASRCTGKPVTACDGVARESGNVPGRALRCERYTPPFVSTIAAFRCMLLNFACFVGKPALNTCWFSARKSVANVTASFPAMNSRAVNASCRTAPARTSRSTDTRTGRGVGVPVSRSSSGRGVARARRATATPSGRRISAARRRQHSRRRPREVTRICQRRNCNYRSVTILSRSSQTSRHP